MTWHKVYAKFLVALGAAVGVFIAAAADGTITGAEWTAVGIAFLGALGVRQIRNRPKS